MSQCESRMLTGGQCDLEANHEGPHEKRYPTRVATWTDESQKRFIDEHLSRFD